MSEAVVAADPDSITDIQDYLQSFNKEIGGTGEQNEASNAIATTSTNMVGDAIYTIDGQKLTGNIVIAESGEHAEQAGQYPTFMVMDNQQYMLIMSNDGDQASTSEQAQIVVSTNDETVVNEAAPVNNHTPETRGKKASFRNKRIKQEIIEEDNRNDISVYDFNELNMSNRNNATVNTSADAGAGDMDAETEDSDDPDFKTPIMSKPRGRPSKNSESGKKGKSSTPIAMGSIGGSSSGNVHVCTYCNYTSNKRYLLSRHLKSHSEDRPHKCGICERGFKVIFITDQCSRPLF